MLTAMDLQRQAFLTDCIGLGVFAGAFVVLAYLAMHFLLVEKR